MSGQHLSFTYSQTEKKWTIFAHRFSVEQWSKQKVCLSQLEQHWLGWWLCVSMATAHNNSHLMIQRQKVKESRLLLMCLGSCWWPYSLCLPWCLVCPLSSLCVSCFLTSSIRVWKLRLPSAGVMHVLDVFLLQHDWSRNDNKESGNGPSVDRQWLS